MKYTTLDKIIRGYLLKKRYPIHFYIECLAQSATCLQDLHFDTLGNVKTVKLEINQEYKSATLPCDFMDWCKIGVASGQFIKPLTERQGITRLNNTNATTGDKTLFGSVETGDNAIFGWSRHVTYNDKWENVGRLYGKTSNSGAAFKVIKEREEIQFDEQLSDTHIVLEYISDGSEIDNATQITPYARATIEAYMDWKHKETHRSYSEGQRERAKQHYNYQHRLLRGRLNTMTINDLRAIIQKRTHGSIK